MPPLLLLTDVPFTVDEALDPIPDDIRDDITSRTERGMDQRQGRRRCLCRPADGGLCICHWVDGLQRADKFVK